MKSINFPKMFNSVNTKTIKDLEATKQNLRLLLLSWKTSLFGDPYYGTNIKRILFEQNNKVTEDRIIDDIYTAITDFMPQILLRREDITVKRDKDVVYITIRCANDINHMIDTYELRLMSEEY